MDMPRSMQVLSPVPLVRDAEPYNNNEDGEGRGVVKKALENWRPVRGRGKGEA